MIQDRPTDRLRFIFEIEKLYANAQELAARTKELTNAVENAISIQAEVRRLRADLDRFSMRIGLEPLPVKSKQSNVSESTG